MLNSLFFLFLFCSISRIAPLSSRLPHARSSASLPRIPLQRAVVETGGEMPEGASSQPDIPPISSVPAKLPLGNVPSTPLRSFPQYDEAEGIRTPDPIRVVRAKKKGTGRKKKPREVINDADT